MSGRDPIDFDSPLGISKREWIKVLGANLALLLVVYVVALICTLCGSDLFLLNFHSDDLQRIEETLRGWGIYPVVQAALSTIEMGIVASYIAKALAFRTRTDRGKQSLFWCHSSCPNTFVNSFLV